MIALHANDLAKEDGKPVVFNICTLGALIGLTHVISKESILRVLETKIPAAFLEMNTKAFEIGLDLAQRAPEKTGS